MRIETVNRELNALAASRLMRLTTNQTISLVTHEGPEQLVQRSSRLHFKQIILPGPRRN